MNRNMCSSDPKSIKDLVFSIKLREFSPIRREEADCKASEVHSKHNHFILRAPESLPTRPNTSAKSFYSEFEEFDCFSINNIESLREKVKEIEVKINKNLNLMDEKLVKNENLNKVIESMEKKLGSKRKSCCDSSNIICKCDTSCTVW